MNCVLVRYHIEGIFIALAYSFLALQSKFIFLMPLNETSLFLRNSSPDV